MMGFALLAGGRARAAPAPGTAIDNTARGSATDSISGRVIAGVSNTVTAVVQALEAGELRDPAGRLVAPGATATFAHALVNLGNVTTGFRIGATNLAGDDFDAASFALARDVDGDGALGPGDVLLAPGDVVTLAPGDSAALLLVATAPAVAPPAAVARVRLTATSTLQGALAEVVDTLRTPSAAPPRLAFYSGADFSRTILATTLGAPLFLRASAPQCDADPTRPDTLTLRLSSRLTQDAKTCTAVETGPATGVFVVAGVPVAVGNDPTAGPASSALHEGRGDLLTAELFGCGATQTSASVWVAPGGVVFDSHTDAPVPGARVQLLDVSGQGNGSPGGLALVYQGDGVTPAPAEVYTDRAGQYAFPIVPASTYRVVVAPPSPWQFPSRVPAAQLPGGHLLDAAASYGADFVVATSGSPIFADVPVDVHGEVTLFAEKTAGTTRAEWGDEVEYTVRVANRSDSLLDAATMRDTPPAGFAFVPGTARVNGASAPDPARVAGTLVFPVGAMAPHAELALDYRMLVGPGAPEGDAVNAAVLVAGAHVSNTASATVRVAGDVFASEGTILGRVGLAQPGAPVPGEGIAGVRLVLDDGTWAITDGDGRFSFTGVTPRTHALKLDATTLPAGAHVVALAHRDGDRPGARFVDLTRGELVRADFAVAGDSALSAVLAARRDAVRALGGDERARVIARGAAALSADVARSDPRTLPAERVTTGETSLPVFDGDAAPAPAAKPDTTGAASAAASAPGRPGDPGALERTLAASTPEFDFVGLGDLDTVSARQVAVVVKGPAGATLALRVNGEGVPESRVDRRFTASAQGVGAWEYLGVPLKPGLNVLEVVPAGAALHRTLRLVAPGPLARIVLRAPTASPADGHGAAPLEIQLTDAAGVRVGERTLVTVECAGASLRADDLDPATPGVQVAIEGGRLRLAVAAPSRPLAARVTAGVGDVQAATVIEFVPELRPLIAVGAAEGVVSLRSLLRAGALVRQMPAASFEAPVEQFASASGDGRASAEAHAALFAKGRVGRRSLLTLGYDSDRPDDLRQFRDQQPDRGWVVVGDASTRGYDAQSTGHLYARLEQREGAVGYGDFVAGDDADRRVLGHYSRSLTGVSSHWRLGAAQLSGFTSRERTHRTVEEMGGTGTSGPYVLAHPPIVENSERVEIVVRDRVQPAVVLSATTRERFTDYELDPLTGRLIFRSPVPSVDADLDPVSVRVTYERRDGGEPAWVNGMDGTVALTSRLSAGGTYVDDHDPVSPFELRGASASLRLAPRSTLDAEWATTRRVDGGAGDAGRVELRVQDRGLDGRLWGMSSSPRFQNPGAGFGAGRVEAGASMSARLADRTHLSAQGLFTSGGPGQDRREGFLLAVDRALNDALRGELGARWSRDDGPQAGAGPASAAVRARLAAQLPRHPAWSSWVETEQDTRDLDRHMAALGGEYRFSARGRLYTRHELGASPAGPWDLNASTRQAASVLGVDADLAREAHVFSEYRLDDALAGREAQAAVGLRDAWPLDHGVRVGTSFERVEPLRGDAGPSTAVTGSLDFAGDAAWRGSARVELRSSRASDQFLESMGAAFRLDSCWTGLTRYLLTLGDAGRVSPDDRQRLQLAFAYRTGAAWDALGRWDFAYERHASAGGPSRRVIANAIGLNAAGRTRGWESTLGWAGKLTRTVDGAISAGGAQWLRGRVTRDFGRAWDAGISASVLTGRRIAQRQYGLGAEVGRQLGGGAWLSLGYNRFGYTDDLLTGEEWTREGGYLRLRVKVDELLLRPGTGAQP